MYSVCFKKDFAKRFLPSSFVIRYSTFDTCPPLEDSAVRFSARLSAAKATGLITKKSCHFGVVSYERFGFQLHFCHPTSILFSLTLETLSRFVPGPPPENLRSLLLVSRCLTQVKKYLYSPIPTVSEFYVLKKPEYPTAS